MQSKSDKQNFVELFHFVRPLGKGAFGKVVEAIDLETGEAVAVKIINKQNCSEPQLIKLRREAEILSTLSHPNIVQFKKVTETDKHIYLVMELM